MTSVLESSELLRGLNSLQQAQLLAYFTKREYNSGDLILEEGKKGNELFLIAEGYVKIKNGDVDVAEFGPGEIFGEVSLVDLDERTGSVYATTELAAYVLNSVDWAKMHMQLPWEIMRRYNYNLLKIAIKRSRLLISTLSDCLSDFAEIENIVARRLKK